MPRFHKYKSFEFSFNFSVIHCLLFVWFCAHFTSCLTFLSREFNPVSSQEIIGTDVFFEIVDPKELAYTYKIRPAQDFGMPFNNSLLAVNVPLMLVDPPTACSDVLNAYDIKGNVAFVQRGDCSFLSKAVRIEKAGAIAIIVTDYDKDNDAFYFEMADDNTHREVNIPAGFILGKNGFVIIKTLARLKRKFALINLPINVSNLAIHKINQPPWINW